MKCWRSLTLPGSAADFGEALKHSRVEELRLRQTVVGPHRDDLQISVQGISAQQYASEGQQRTVALALKLAQARVLAVETGAAPLLLLDDIFGELDPERRNASWLTFRQPRKSLSRPRPRNGWRGLLKDASSIWRTKVF